MSTDPAVRWLPAKPGDTPGSLAPGEDEAEPLPAPALVPVVRPNGKVYRPRKAPVAVGVCDGYDDVNYVYVLRTHDIDRARAFARPYLATYLVAPRQEWVRLVMRRGYPVYEDDEERGVPVVVFTASDDPEVSDVDGPAHPDPGRGGTEARARAGRRRR